MGKVSGERERTSPAALSLTGRAQPVPANLFLSRIFRGDARRGACGEMRKLFTSRHEKGGAAFCAAPPGVVGAQLETRVSVVPLPQ